jgi:uncharacterized protein
MDIEQGNLDFDEIANLLLGQAADCSPSELHGCVTGQLASGVSAPVEYYLKGASQVLDVDIHGPLVEAVLAMIVNISEQLNDEGFTFQPLLPDDDMELSQRVEALGQWCQGLLAGFALGMTETQAGAGGDVSSPALSVEVSETLSDLSAISQAGFDEEEEHEQAEQDFFDVLEYSRLAALSLYMEHTQEDTVPTEESDSIGNPAGLFGKKLH